MTLFSIQLWVFWVGVRVTRLLIRVLGFARTVTLLGSLPPALGRRPADAVAATSWARSIDRASGRPYGGTCLDRSVFLWSLMRLHRLDGNVRIGISLDGDSIAGHAWVEVDGVVINDTPDVAESFAVFEDDPVGIAFR